MAAGGRHFAKPQRNPPTLAALGATSVGSPQNDSSADSASDEQSDIEPEVVEVFDALYEVVRDREPLQQSFVDRLNEANQLLSERIETAVRETTRAHLERKRLIEARRKAQKARGEGPEAPESE